MDTVALMWISTVAYLAFIGILLKLKLKDNNGNFIVKIVGRIKPLPINTRTGKPIQLIEIFIKSGEVENVASEKNRWRAGGVGWLLHGGSGRGDDQITLLLLLLLLLL